MYYILYIIPQYCQLVYSPGSSSHWSLWWDCMTPHTLRCAGQAAIWLWSGSEIPGAGLSHCKGHQRGSPVQGPRSPSPLALSGHLLLAEGCRPGARGGLGDEAAGHCFPGWSSDIQCRCVGPAAPVCCVCLAPAFARGCWTGHCPLGHLVCHGGAGWGRGAEGAAGDFPVLAEKLCWGKQMSNAIAHSCQQRAM